MDIERVVQRSVCEGRNNSSVERLILKSVRSRIERSDLAEWPDSRISAYLRTRYRSRESPEGVVLLGVYPKN
ncbi:hypothetical protein Pan44_35340 [Caulifigura coniformis]|uniref:Uncharacterized protein n=1 Tax=Caulifigura coniformis TaxID=2527983 RepID=A0A517SH91_9PLAN|nr:hypothetical protein [Caulifigura coniformis]QDT55490.1 hypothetical protein Pan44_35340 [Caulifigura coniformis]